MRRLINSRIWVLICLAALAIVPASADIVTYSTTGVFTSSGSDVYSGAHGLTITYGDTLSNVVVVPPPSTASFGTFTVAGPTTGFTDTVLDTFTLTIAQSTPTLGNEVLLDTFQGTIAISSSQVKLIFTGGGPQPAVLGSDPNTGAPAWTFDLGNIQYWVYQKTPIVPSTNNHGVSTINGSISTVPDGGVTLMLLGGALVGLETLRRKFRA
jgi:hypothetical protein